MPSEVLAGEIDRASTTDLLRKEVVLADADMRRRVLKKYGLLTPAEHVKLCEREHESHSLVGGFIQGRSVSVLVGDSGLGKSPLAYQLGLAVAAGLPFLGFTTKQGLVVYADHENGAIDGLSLRNAVAEFLALPAVPETFLSWYPDAASPFNLEAVCRELGPKLVILDSLRSYDPTFEQTENAGERMRSLRSAAYGSGAAILAIHHIKKPGQFGSPSLERDSLMQWLNEAAGHRSLINQSDTRIAVALPATGDAAMVMRWQRRLRGESGPLYVARIVNDAGEPIGYRPMNGPELLGNPNQQDAFGKLPSEEFTFKQAKQAYGHADDPTRKWLLKCEAVGIVQQVARGRYRKTWPQAVEAVEESTK